MKLFPHNRKDWSRLFLRWAVVALLVSAIFVYSVTMPRASYHSKLPPLSAGQEEIKDRLRMHVEKLAGEIGERNTEKSEELNAAAAYIEKRLTALGLKVSEQRYNVSEKAVFNIAAEMTGSSLRDEIIVVGGHYDSVPGSPGANDNASGVAAMLEVARLLLGKKIERTVRFVAFTNEEPPFFQTDNMGSLVYARQCRARGEKIVAMLSLETIGYYTERPGSQKYPAPFRLIYPDTGNFIGFVGNMRSRALVRRALDTFRATTPFPSEGVAAPGWIMGVEWSDHWSFGKEGYRALMVTDTAPFRYADYHEYSDTPDKLDYDRMARVVSGITEVVTDLSDR